MLQQEFDHLGMLRQVALFQSLNDQQLAQVAAFLRTVHYRKGEIICHQNDPGTCMYLIGEGDVRVYLSSADGREVTLRNYGRGDYVGEFAVLDGAPRSASIAANTNVTAFVLYGDDLENLMRHNFTLVQSILKNLIERLRYTTTYSEWQAFLDASQRVAAILLQLVSAQTETQIPIRLEVTQHELASLANTSREWVNQTLRDFVEQGLVRTERGAVQVLDLAGLRQIVNQFPRS